MVIRAPTQDCGVAGGRSGRETIECTEVGMAKKSRKKKARRKSAANHGKRPNS